jgi:cytosine/adenosine deaminase-related metal-dependent hydrolase
MKHATSAIWGTLEKHATTFIKGVLIPDEAIDGGYGYSCVDVTLAGGKIAGLVPTGTAPAPKGCIIIDGGNKLLLPGAVNAHTHTSEHWARGLIKPLPLELWIHQLVRGVSSYTAVSRSRPAALHALARDLCRL